jgi:hypothetical protein
MLCLYSYNEDDYYLYRNTKYSQPDLPNSTSLSLLTFSYDLLLPIPDYIPLATPKYSPRLRPYSRYDLPAIYNLSL